VLAHNRWSVAADMYSYGVILWALCTRNTQPFRKFTAEVGIDAVIDGVRPILTTAIPQQLQQVIHACWHQNPDQRWCAAQVKVG